jgi:colanic acid biosynthesis glycosyl transferase WcaI
VRIALLNQFYAPDISPTAQLAASLAEHRAELGDDVTVLTGRAGYLEGLGPAGPSGVGGAASGVRIRRAWTPDLGRASIGRRLVGYLTYLVGTALRLLRLPAQHVVVAMTTPPFVVGLAVLHKLLHPRTRVVLWSMDCYPDVAERFEELRPGGLGSRALRALNRALFRRIDHVVALDGAMADLLSQYAAAPGAPPISVVPNWERASLFPRDVEPARWRGWDALPVDGRTVVVYLGNLGVGHRFDTVVAAAAALADDALFVFIGGGARRDELGRAVQERGLGNVVIRDYVPKEETAGVMAGADAALITLDERALGIMSPSKLHANLAAGLPVLYVGPPGSNVDEAIARFGCGTSLREGDVDGVVAFVRALRDPGAGALRARARAAFDAAYSDEAALPRLDAVLEGRA